MGRHGLGFVVCGHHPSSGVTVDLASLALLDTKQTKGAHRFDAPPTWPSSSLPVISRRQGLTGNRICRGPKHHIHIRILHSGSKAQDKGFQKPWFAGSLCLCDLSGPLSLICRQLCACNCARLLDIDSQVVQQLNLNQLGRIMALTSTKVNLRYVLRCVSVYIYIYSDT